MVMKLIMKNTLHVHGIDRPSRTQGHSYKKNITCLVKMTFTCNKENLSII